jgi:hypothetical protein
MPFPREAHRKLANGLNVNTLLIHPRIKRRSLESPKLADLNRVNLPTMNKPLQCSRVDFQQCCGLVAIEQGFSAHQCVEAVMHLVCGRFHFVLHLCSFRQQRDNIAISARFIHDDSDV